MKNEYSIVMESSEAVIKRWKEYFEKLMNEENDQEPRTEEAEVVAEEVNYVSREEEKNALRRMRKSKAVGPDELPVEIWKCVGEIGIKFLTKLFNKLLVGERMPEEWRNVFILICANTGDAQCCGSYRGIKLMSHTIKIWKIIIKARLKNRVKISKQQYGFMAGKGTTDAMFALKMMVEKYKEGQRELYCVLMDLEKAYDRVPREELRKRLHHTLSWKNKHRWYISAHRICCTYYSDSFTFFATGHFTDCSSTFSGNDISWFMNIRYSCFIHVPYSYWDCNCGWLKCFGKF